jgi:hypothetical protein
MAPSQIEETPIFAEDTVVIEFWIPLKQDRDYEINDVSLKIRHIETKIEVRLYNHNYNYIQVYVGGKNYYYHRLIAEMFVYNPDPLTRTYVDHIDRNKHNNIIENLQWVSPSENCLNKPFFRNYEGIFVKSLPVNARQVTHYKEHELKFQYFVSNDSIYVKTNTEYRQLNIIKDRYVNLRYKNDSNNHLVCLRILLNANAQ